MAVHLLSADKYDPACFIAPLEAANAGDMNKKLNNPTIRNNFSIINSSSTLHYLPKLTHHNLIILSEAHRNP